MGEKKFLGKKNAPTAHTHNSPPPAPPPPPPRPPQPPLAQASTGALSSPQVRDRLVRVNQPQQAQEPNEDDLAEEGVAVDEEGNRPANDGSFDQIKNSHMTVFRSRPDKQPRYLRLSDKAVANPSALPIIIYASAIAVQSQNLISRCVSSGPIHLILACLPR